MATAELLAEEVALELGPGATSYEGVATLTLRAAEGDTAPEVHALGLEVDVELDGRVVAHRVDGDRLQVEGTLGEGPHALKITFRGRPQTLPRGLFRFEVQGRTYLATDFEPSDARRAWPCVDDPAVKVPWTLSVGGLGAGDTALSTMPGRRDGDRVTFPPTPPLPAYAVGLMVGPYVPHPAMASPPATVWTVAGHEDVADSLVEELPPAWAAVSAGLPALPWPKLDFVVLPDLMAGGMENPGVITISERALAFGWAKEIAAHELAHLWFGDWVTPHTWEDLWLSESFADWFGSRHLGHLSMREHERAAGWAEARTHAPPLRPARDGWRHADHAAMYHKGAVVLDRLAASLRPEGFEAWTRSWLTAHAGRTATTGDFLGSLPAWARAELEPLVTESGMVRVSMARAPGGVRLTRSSFLREGQRRAPPPGITRLTLIVPEQPFPLVVELGTEPFVVPLAPGEAPFPSATFATWDASGPLLHDLLAAMPTLPVHRRVAALGDLLLAADAGHVVIQALLDATPADVRDEGERALWVSLWDRLEHVHATGDPAAIGSTHRAIVAARSRLFPDDVPDPAPIHGGGTLPGDEAWQVVRSGTAVHPWDWAPVRGLAEAGAPGLGGELRRAVEAEGDPRARHLAAWTWAADRGQGSPDHALSWALDPTAPRALRWTVLSSFGERPEAPVRDRVFEALAAAWPTLSQDSTPDEQAELVALAVGCSAARADRAADAFDPPASWLALVRDEAVACEAEQRRWSDAARAWVQRAGP